VDKLTHPFVAFAVGLDVAIFNRLVVKWRVHFMEPFSDAGGRVEVPSAPLPSRSVARAATGWPRVDDGEPVVAVRSQIRPAGDARRNRCGETAPS
jgi:hypothetical protein